MILGDIKSGKNNMIVTKFGKHFPRRAWAEWRDGVLAQLMPYRPMTTFQGPLAATFVHVPGDAIRRDVPGMMDAIFHCLERAFIVQNDNQFKCVSWVETEINRTSPSLEITIDRLGL